MAKPNFTASQSKALRLDANIFVEAGAGSGKTTVLVHRLLDILLSNPHLDVSQVVAITFTRKAASEMKARLRHEIEKVADDIGPDRYQSLIRSFGQIQISTIHGFCSAILRRFPIEARLDPSFAVLEEDVASMMRRQAMRDAIRQLQRQESPALKTYLLSHSARQLREDLDALFHVKRAIAPWMSKYAMEPIEDILAVFGPMAPDEKGLAAKSVSLLAALGEIFAVYLARYEGLKIQQGCLDSDDLIEKASALLSESEVVKQYYQSHFAYIMVDEFQDTDRLQWALVLNLIKSQALSADRKLFLVGDMKQSIYSFRSAEPALFMAARDQFELANTTSEVVLMNENFRSHPMILEFVNELFRCLFDPESYRPLIASGFVSASASVQFALFEESETHHQYDWMAGQILRLKTDNPDLAFSDVAILCRTKRHLEIIRHALNAQGIPAEVYSGQGFFRKSEVLDLYHLVKAILSPYQNLNWIGVLKSPLFGLSEEGILALYQACHEPKLVDKLNRLATSLPQDLQAQGFSESDVPLILDAAIKIGEWVRSKHLQPLADLVESALRQTGADVVYLSQPEGERKWANIQKLIAKLRTILEIEYADWSDVEEILDHHLAQTALEAEETLTSESDKVQILTIHASKGLEFPVVMMSDLDQKFNFPFMQRIVVADEVGIGLSLKGDTKNVIREAVLKRCGEQLIDEEKRIFYVACTRAKTHLFLSARQRKRPTEHSFLGFLQSVFDFDDGKMASRESNLVYPFYTSPLVGIAQRESGAPEEIVSPSLKLSINRPCSARRIRYMTVSDLELYLECPRKYALKSFQQVSAEATTRLSSSALDAALFGDIVHRLFQAKMLSLELTPDSDLISSYVAQIAGPKWQDDLSLIAEIQTHLDRFSQSDILARSRQAEAFTEFPLNLKIDSLLIIGRMDLVLKSPGKLEIVDYKTGFLEADNSEKIEKAYKFQLGVYVLALKERHPELTSPPIATLYFTRTGHHVTYTFTDSELADISTLISRIAKALEIDLEWIAPPLALCESCHVYKFNTDCPTTARFLEGV